MRGKKIPLAVLSYSVQAAVDERTGTSFRLLQSTDDDVLQDMGSVEGTRRAQGVSIGQGCARQGGNTHSALTSDLEYLISTWTPSLSVLEGQDARVSTSKSNETSNLDLMGQIMTGAVARTTEPDGVEYVMG